MAGGFSPIFVLLSNSFLSLLEVFFESRREGGGVSRKCHFNSLVLKQEGKISASPRRPPFPDPCFCPFALQLLRVVAGVVGLSRWFAVCGVFLAGRFTVGCLARWFGGAERRGDRGPEGISALGRDRLAFVGDWAVRAGSRRESVGAGIT